MRGTMTNPGVKRLEMLDRYLRESPPATVRAGLEEALQKPDPGPLTRKNDRDRDRHALPAQRPSTIIQVAEHAGVSVSTAARVLRGSELPVAKHVAQRVRASAREVGYVPNAAARSLRGTRPGMIGLIVGDMLDSYYGQIAEAITHAAEAQHGMLAIVCNMRRDPLLEVKHCRQLWEHRVSGLILAGGGFDQHVCKDELATLVQAMQGSGVVVTTLGPRFVDAPSYCVDNRLVGKLAAVHLLEAGHRNVGLITGSTRSETARQRLAGSMEAFAAAGAEASTRHASFVSDSVLAATASLIREHPEITAILAGSDSMARTIIAYLGSVGISVPKQISVIGIGNTMAASVTPSLSTVELHLAACARAALNCIAHGGQDAAGFAPPEPYIVQGGTVLQLG